MSRRGCSRGKAEEKAVEIGAPEHVRTVPAATPREDEPPVEDGFADAVGRLVPAVRRGLARREERALDRGGTWRRRRARHHAPPRDGEPLAADRARGREGERGHGLSPPSPKKDTHANDTSPNTTRGALGGGAQEADGTTGGSEAEELMGVVRSDRSDGSGLTVGRGACADVRSDRSVVVVLVVVQTFVIGRVEDRRAGSGRLCW